MTGVSLESLLDLDGFLAEVGGGSPVKIVARRVPPAADQVHGVSYTLTPHDSGGRRVFGIDNAHSIRPTRGPSGRSSTVRDHLHRGDSVRSEEGGCRMKRTLKVSIAPREAIVRSTRDVVAGRKKRTADDPDIWFTSVESFAKILSDRNRALLAMIAECRPESIDALAAVSGRAKSNLSRTLHTMAQYGLVRLEKGQRRKVRPVVIFERVELKLNLTA
jgi:predicted transcriptional regulator